MYRWLWVSIAEAREMRRKLMNSGFAAASKAFGDIRHNRNTRAADLIPQAEIGAELAAIGHFINLRRQSARFFPTFNLFESANGHTT
jgi:hypothetical protein